MCVCVQAMKTAITQPEPVEKTKALGLVLHTADISHPAKEWDVHYKWTMLVIEEFFQQGDREAQLGLPYSPLCDRHTLVIPDSQIGTPTHPHFMKDSVVLTQLLQ